MHGRRPSIRQGTTPASARTGKPSRPQIAPSGIAERPRRPLLTAAQLAALHDVDERTVRRWVRAGLPVARRGKAGHRGPSFDPAAVDGWLERNADQERGLVRALCSKIDAQARASARTLSCFGLPYLRPLLRVRTSRTLREARSQLAELQGELIDIRNRTLTPEEARGWIRAMWERTALRLTQSMKEEA